MFLSVFLGLLDVRIRKFRRLSAHQALRLLDVRCADSLDDNFDVRIGDSGLRVERPDAYGGGRGDKMTVRTCSVVQSFLYSQKLSADGSSDTRTRTIPHDILTIILNIGVS